MFFLLFKRKIDAKTFLIFQNEQHPNFKFTIKKETGF